MPKTRPYSREELRGLRRADLQRLCKTYDIKGANAKSEVLIEVLAKYFTSPAYLSSPRPERSRARPQAKATVGSRTLNPIPRRTATTRSAVGPPPATQSNSAPNPHVPTPVHPAVPEVTKSIEAGGSTTATSINGNPHQVVQNVRAVNPTAEVSVADSSSLSHLQQEMSRLTDVMSTWQRDQELAIDRLVDTRVAQRLDFLIQQQMAAVERREAIVKQREEALEEAWRQFELKLRRSGLAGVAFHKEDDSSMPVPGSGVLPSSGEKRRRSASDNESPSKRARLQPVPSSPRTPPSTIESDMGPGRFNVPRTPSPNLPVAAAYSILMDDESPSAIMSKQGLPSLPGAPPSPTLGRFDQASIITGPLPKTATPKRSAAQLASSSQESISTASVGGKRHAVASVAPSSTPPMANKVTDQSPSAPASSAAAFQGGSKIMPHRAAPSPRREYMDVALNGLVNNSPSAMATPNSRTLLGTERYRDTRFGDEPFVPWTSPTVEYEPNTPSM